MLRKTCLKILLFSFFLVGSVARAEGDTPFDLSYKHHDTNNQLLVGVQLVGITIGAASLSGGGIRFAYEYSFSRNWSVMSSLALVTGSSGYLYSGFDAHLRYSIMGSSGVSESEIQRAGVPVVTQTENRDHRLSASVGLEQLFLNGARSVYPAAGITAGIAYTFPLFSQWTEISVRGSKLTSGARSANAIIFDYSILFGL